MSVAFRREGDEEHLEPKFDIPIPPGPTLVTANGLAQIRAQVAELEAQFPALTEEAEITAARRHLRYWRARQATAQVMPAADGSHVTFGCMVAFQMNGQRRTITIVGDDEARPAAGLLSYSAPLCRAMMDAEVGDMVDFGGKAEAIEIVGIQPAS